MSVINITQRWYDLDPTLSLAISIFRNTSHENQLLLANYLLEKVDDIDLLKSQAKKRAIFFNRRWYDFNEEVFLTVEYIRLSSPEIQNTLALEIINYLCTIDSNFED